MNSKPVPIQEEVLRRVGRNLLLFQQMEYLLKWLLSNHKGGGTADTIRSNAQEHKDCINRKMLGHLVEKFGNELLQDAGEPVSETDGPEGWFSYSYRITADASFVEAKRQDLKLMTDERNQLVHHFLPRWQPDSPGKMAEAVEYLDSQHEKLLPLHAYLKSTVAQMQETQRLASALMDSPDFERQVEMMWLQGSPLVRILHSVATQYHRTDGWTYLALAGDLVAKEAQQEVKDLMPRYGFKTLRQLLVGSEIFDVLDEPLANGGFRTLYRIKTGVDEVE